MDSGAPIPRLLLVKGADPEFWAWQAKDLLDHLESVLANGPVVMKRGQHIGELKLEGISKGVVVEDLIAAMTSKGKSPDMLCIGDVRSDEDMFESITSWVGKQSSPEVAAEVFVCIFDQNPSTTKDYLNDTYQVVKNVLRPYR